MAEQWFLAKIYYSMPDLESPEDPSGDALITQLVRPVLQHCFTNGWIRWGHFMRFSEEGYHIRLTVYGDPVVLKEQFMPYLRDVVARHRAAHPEVTQSPMQLSPLAMRLNRKWGGPKEDFHVYTPDSTVMGLAHGVDDEAVFESPQAYAAHHTLHTDGCARAIELLMLAPSHRLRMAFVRLLMDDFLRMTDLSELERYCFLDYLKMQWVQYFDLDQNTLAPFLRFHQEREGRYHTYFSNKRGPEDSLPLLPAPVRPLYQRWITALQELTPAIGGRTPDGRLTPYISLRLLAFFHLMHNRIGVGILQEVYLAHVLGQFYRTHLTPQQIEAAESWARALHERSVGAEGVQLV